MTVVLDYGMGNLRSVERAIHHLGFACSVQSDLKGASKLIIPGVGAFRAAMERLETLRGEIRRFADAGKPLLGICLGQQLLFERSEELTVDLSEEHQGLSILNGSVRYFPEKIGVKVPHMGWNQVTFNEESRLGRGFPEGGQVYFVHSLVTVCDQAEDVAATCEHGIQFAAAVERDNVWGTQFHPEKSGEIGLGLLRNFLEC